MSVAAKLIRCCSPVTAVMNSALETDVGLYRYLKQSTNSVPNYLQMLLQETKIESCIAH